MSGAGTGTSGRTRQISAMLDTGRLSTVLADRYQIERHIGQGGMATVYLARDLKHHRKVALKVLRPELAAIIGAERFLKEIEVTAGLQHPNILPLYDSGHAEHFLYYVMPYVEGESLRGRLNREKQLSLEDTLSIAKAVAAALHYAHRHDVVHRDVKPENILLHDGQALVADFGIALAVSQAGGTRMTETGLSLGTPQYMSPEQATGDRTIDARSDIYSLGAVTYEMLTGDPPHTGNTVQAIVARILAVSPTPITQVRERVPLHVEAAVERALAKTPADRFASAAEYSAALSNPSFTAATVAAPAPEVPPAKAATARRLTGALAAALVVVTAALAWSLFRDRGAPIHDALRLAVALPESRPITFGQGHSPVALSPDGAAFAYTGLADGKQVLLLRRMNGLAAEPIPGTEGGTQPFFSPDGKWLGFFASGFLKKVSITGGPPVPIAPVGNARGGTWTDDGYIVFTPTSASALYRVRDGGGTPEQITQVDSAERARGVTGHRYPSALPGGRGILYTSFTGLLSESRIAVVALPSRRVTQLISGGTFPRYTATGHVLYVNADGALAGVPFDAARLDTTGSPITLEDAVAVDASTHAAFYSISDSGTLVFLQGSLIRGIVRVNRDGSEQVLLDSLVAPASLRFSKRGDRIAMEMQAQHQLRIWSFDLERRVNTPLTFDGQSRYPTWSPSGDRILFSYLGAGTDRRDIYDIAADGSGSPRLVYSAPDDQFEASLLPDGKHLVVRQTNAAGERDILMVPLDTAQRSADFVHTPGDERSIALSPDGRWLAYISTESGQSEVYVRAVPGPGGKWQISRNGGTEPAWSADGQELFYRDPQNLMSVSVDTRGAFVIRGSRPLFKAGLYGTSADRASYDVHPSGKWFAMTRNFTTRADLIVVVNWFTELRSKFGK